MIDLNYTKAQMLSEIQASERASANRLNDAADPGFVSLDEACLTVNGETPDDLLPALEAAFSKRFASVPPDRLSRDLIDALKKGVGNRFDTCRRSHPGFDVGSFLAELLKFYLLRKKAEPNFYYAGREVFLEAYFGGNLPSWQDDLPFFLAGALLLRFDRLLHRRRGKKWKCDAFLEQCEPALQWKAPS